MENNKFPEKCNSPTDIYGNNYKYSNNLIIIKIKDNVFMCLTRQEYFHIIKDYSEKPVIEFPTDEKGQLLQQRSTFNIINNEEEIKRIESHNFYISNKMEKRKRDIKYHHFKLLDDTWVDSSFEEMFIKRINTMELVYKKTSFIHRSYGISALHDYKTKIYEVKPLKRCVLFDNCNKNNENNHFNDLFEGDEPDEIESSEINEEEMKKNAEILRIKFKEENDRRLERKYNIVLEDEKCEIKNNNNVKTLILKESVKTLDIFECDNLELLKFNHNLEKLNIIKCIKLKSLNLNNKLEEFKLESCNIDNIVFNNNLKIVSIYNCNFLQTIKIDSESSIHVKSCHLLENIYVKNIKSLYISFCPKINEQNILIESKFLDDISLLHLNIKNIPVYEFNIKNIDIADCKYLEFINIPKNIENAIIYMNENLKKIYTNEILKTLGIASDNLTELFLEKSINLTSLELISSHLEYIIGKLPNSLNTISLECPNLKELPNIPTSLEKLTTVNCELLKLPNSNIKYTLN